MSIGSGGGIFGGGSGGIGGSTGATDNAILRADGAGGATAQTSAVQVDDSGHVLPATTTVQDLGSTAAKWRRLIVDDTNGIIMHHTASGTSNRMNFTNGVGPRWYDGGLDIAATFNIQSLSDNRTFTWPNVAGTVVVGSAVGTTVGAAGAASALPAAPLGYLSVTLPDGTLVKVPYYNT